MSLGKCEPDQGTDPIGKNEQRRAVKRVVPPEVMEKRKVRRKVKRKINRWIHSHDKDPVYEVLREVVRNWGIKLIPFEFCQAPVLYYIIY